MKSTKLADYFYKIDINPFYVIAPLVFIVPLSMFLLCFFVVSLNVVNSIFSSFIVFLCCSLIFYLYFHRNPDRKIISDENAVLSPADGKIIYIKKIDNGKIIESIKKKNHMRLTELLDVTGKDVNCETGYIVGIELQLFDIHVTRCPISGKKILDHHVSGRIVSMNNPQFELINDRETVVIREEMKGDDNSNFLFQIAVVQIATYITRTVRSLIHDKSQLIQGEPMGMIRLGSQVDLILFSSNVNIVVNEGDRVYAGVTKIAEISKQ